MNRKHFTTRQTVILIVVAVIALTAIGMVFNKASVKRWFRDVQSEFNNGVERTITVYDISGNVVKEYDGKFDVEIENQKIKFDDAEGKRHIVVLGSGTVCIDDKEQ